MTTSSTALIVRCCADCPFFGGVPVISAISELLSEPGARGSMANVGTCNFDRDTGTVIRVRLGLVGPERDEMLKTAQRRMTVLDKTTIPEKCPLRNKDVVVSLGS